MSEDAKLLLLRNVHPHFYDNGRVGSGGFTPTEQHDYQLSVDLDILSSPELSRERHERLFKLASAGVFGVTIGEFEEQDVSCRADPVIGNDAHCVADFNKIKEISKSQVKRVGRKLAAIASTRGRLD